MRPSALVSAALAWLCTLLSAWSGAVTATEVVVPNAQATVEGSINNLLPFNCGQLVVAGTRYQQVYAASEVGSGTITEIAFRSDGGSFGPSTLPGVTITLSSTSSAPDTLSTTFASNVGGDVTTVHSGDLTLSSAFAGGPLPAPFDIVIPLTTPFTFDAGAGKNLLLDVTIPSCLTSDAQFSASAVFDAEQQFGAPDSISRVFALTSAATTGSADTSGLVTRFTTGAGPAGLTALSPANVWVGLPAVAGSIDVDLKVGVSVDGVPVGAGRLDGVLLTPGGFSKATLASIPLSLFGPVAVNPGATLSVTTSIRATCVGGGLPGFGSARLWFNGAGANSEFDATIGGGSTTYFLEGGSALGTTAGPGPRQSATAAVSTFAKCPGRAFAPFGTWSTVLP